MATCLRSMATCLRSMAAYGPRRIGTAHQGDEKHIRGV